MNINTSQIGKLLKVLEVFIIKYFETRILLYNYVW